MTALIPRVIADFTTQLSTAISIGSTGFSLASILDDDGIAIPNGKYCVTIDNGSSGKEYLMGTMTAGVFTSVVSVSRQGVETSGAVRAHRIGASVILTDFVAIQRLVDILRGASTLDGGSPLAYDTSPTLSSGLQVATVAYVLSVVTGGTVNFDAQIVSGTAGETLALPNVVYLKEADARWWLSDADLTATFAGLRKGIARGSASAGGAVSVQISGIATGFTGRTPGARQYLSNTAGGVSESAGTNSVFIGWAITSTTILLAFDMDLVPSLSEKAAMVGSQSTPGSSNKFLTQDNTSVAAVDQSQTTQNGSVETGEADATTKKNLIAQSFISTKTKIRGVRLWKIADTGTFTGSVDITLQADSSGSPSGTPLATRSLTNAEWLALGVGEFEALFATEYASLAIGSLYWIVIDPSTSDNSNHPNIGTNTAGGYSSGSSKYKNTTDSWVAISTIDLYFKTLEGDASQIPKTDSTGKLPYQLLSPIFYQRHAITTKAATAGGVFGFAAMPDGSAIFVWHSDGNTKTLTRYGKDTNTGQYFQTHLINPTAQTQPGNGDLSTGMFVVGTKLYVMQVVGGAEANHRYRMYDADTLANETSISGLSSEFSGDPGSYGFYDSAGAFVYIGQGGSSAWSKYTVSGSTLTDSGVNVTFADPGAKGAVYFDGTYVYIFTYSTPTLTIKKYTLAGTLVLTKTYPIGDGGPDMSTAPSGILAGGFVAISGDIAYMVLLGRTFIDAATDVYTSYVHLYPLTKI